MVGRSLLYPADGDVAGAVGARRRPRADRPRRTGDERDVTASARRHAGRRRPRPCRSTAGATPGGPTAGCVVVSLAAGGVERSTDSATARLSCCRSSARSSTSTSTASTSTSTGASSVFDRVTDWAYLPIDAEVRLSPAGRRRGGAARRPGRRRFDPALRGRPTTCAVELRGAGPATRQVNNFMSPEAFDGADKLMCVEVLTPDGNWSSYPPHQHDDSPECPVNNEEIYYFRVGADRQQRLRAGGLRACTARTRPTARSTSNVVVHDGDVFCIPRGYHGPCIAAPGLPAVLPQRAGRPRRRAVDGVLRRPDPPLGARHVGRHADRSAVPDDDDGRCDDDRVSRHDRDRRRRARLDGSGPQPRLPAHPRRYFPDRDYDPELVVVRDAVRPRRDEPSRSFGFAHGHRRLARGRRRTRRRRRRRHRAEHAARRDRRGRRRRRQGRVLREAGRRHAGADRRRRAAARHAGVITGVGYNYRWAPLVQYAKQLIDDGELGDDHQLPRPVPLDVRQRPARACCRGGSCVDEGGYGVSTDLLSHCVDLGHFLVGGIAEVVGTGETFITAAPAAGAGGGTHYDRGAAGDPTGAVTNEDYVGMMCASPAARSGTFEACRSMVGPESQNAFEVYGTHGLARLEPREDERAAACYVAADDPHDRLHAPCSAATASRTTATSCRAEPTAIGFEDLIDRGPRVPRSPSPRVGRSTPGFADALAYVPRAGRRAARRGRRGRWETVVDIAEGGLSVKTIRLTTAEAIVRYLIAQRTVIDDVEVPLFPGVFAIFGHGNVTCLGPALHAAGDALPTWRGQNEQGMALAAVALRQGDAPPPDHGGHLVDRSRRAEHGHRRRRGAWPTGCRCCCCPATRSPSRLPDPVLQQVEHFGDPSTTVNDAFRPSCATGTASPGPSRCCQSLPQAVVDTARPGGLRAGVPRPAAGRAGRGVRLPDVFFDHDGAHHRPAAARPRPGRPRRRRAAGRRAAADRRRRRRPLLAGRGRAGGVRRAPRHPGRRDGRRQVARSPADHPCYAGPIGVIGCERRQPSRRRGRRRAGGRHPAAGLHHRVVDGVRATTRAAHRCSTSPASTPVKHRVAAGGRRRPRGAASSSTRRLAGWRAPTSVDVRADAPARWPRYSASTVDRIGAPQRRAARPTYAQVIGAVDRHGQRARLRADRGRRLPRRAEHRVAVAGRRRRSTASTGSRAWATRSPAGGERRWPVRSAPTARSFVFVGDGSYLMMNSDLYSSVLSGHKMIVIVCDNGGFAVIDRLQVNQGGASFNNLFADVRVAGQWAPVDFAAHAAVDGLRRSPRRRHRRARRRGRAGRGRRTAPRSSSSTSTRTRGPRAARSGRSACPRSMRSGRRSGRRGPRSTTAKADQRNRAW